MKMNKIVSMKIPFILTKRMDLKWFNFQIDSSEVGTQQYVYSVRLMMSLMSHRLIECTTGV